MNRIREARKQAGIKQVDLCARLGISQGALSGWENGKYEPDCAGWLSLSEVLGVSVDYLIGGTASVRLPGIGLQDRELLPDEEQLLTMYRSMNQQGKEYILQTIAMAAQTYKKIDCVANMAERIG